MATSSTLVEREATAAAVLVQLPGGVGRLMGDTYDDRSVRPVLVADLADHLRAMAQAGAAHLQLVLDPITVESIEAVGGAVRSDARARSDLQGWGQGPAPWVGAPAVITERSDRRSNSLDIQ